MEKKIRFALIFIFIAFFLVLKKDPFSPKVKYFLGELVILHKNKVTNDKPHLVLIEQYVLSNELRYRMFRNFKTGHEGSGSFEAVIRKEKENNSNQWTEHFSHGKLTGKSILTSKDQSFQWKNYSIDRTYSDGTQEYLQQTRINDFSHMIGTYGEDFITTGFYQEISEEKYLKLKQEINFF